MTKKITWLLVSCLMAVSLIIASCGPAATEEEEEEEEVVIGEEEEEEEEEETVGPEVSKYGGRITLPSGDILAFDEVTGLFFQATTLRLTNEELWGGDWTTGPAGTNKTDFSTYGDRWNLKAGYIAEDWDFSRLSEGIMTWNIRKGIHWALNPESEASRLVNGRELTADDVVSTLKMHITDSRAYIYKAFPVLRGAEITAPDKYTVVIKVPKEEVALALLRFGECAYIVPPEIVEKHGDMRDWRVSVGTGPFMLTDYVAASSATLVKNSNYWMKDPIGLGKGNQLPYLDGVKFLVIPDKSTQLAAIRTGQLDVLAGISMEDTGTLMEQRPELRDFMYYDAFPPVMMMRTDKTPFNDKRIRRAMMMATDFETINNEFYEGLGRIQSWPLTYAPEYEGAYLSLDDPECPESVKELYKYNPDKARTLLAEAGYPDGFKTTFIMDNRADRVDYFSVVKDQWSKVGIDLTLETLEWGALESVRGGREYEEMVFGNYPPVATYFACLAFSGDQRNNQSFIDDPKVEEAKLEMAEALRLGSMEQADAIYKELMKYVLDQAWAIPTVQIPLYRLWWPWVKNYHGEDTLGYWNPSKWTQFVWIDQELKKSMGH